MRIKVSDINTELKERSKTASLICCDKYGFGYCEPMNYYDTSRSYEYFKRNSNFDNPNEGGAYMIGLATSGTTNNYKIMHNDGVILHLLLSKFVSNLTRNQGVNLSLI